MTEHDHAVAHALERLDAALAAWHKAKLRVKALRKWDLSSYGREEIFAALSVAETAAEAAVDKYTDALWMQAEARRKDGTQ